MSAPEIIGLISDLITIIAIVIGAFIAFFVYFQFAPVIRLSIIPTWIDAQKEYLTVRFQIENKSRVRLYKPVGRIQVLHYAVPPGGSLSQWVPFRKEAILAAEPPREWREPDEVLKSTITIYPGELVSYERLYHIPEDVTVIHIGFQVELRLGFFARIATRKREAWRQTTTCFAVKHAVQGASTAQFGLSGTEQLATDTI
jgi:hypothetical protein